VTTPPWGLAAVALAISAALFLTMFLHGEVLDVLVEEDGIVETTGAIGLVIGVVFAVLALLRERRAGANWFKQLVYLGFAVFLFLSAGEEISWGQRILGFSTPADIGRHNGQDEFNVHNLNGLGSAPELAFLAVWFVLAVVIPVAASSNAGLAERLRRFVPVLPLPFAPLFLGAYAVAKSAETLFGRWSGYDSIYPAVHAATEIKEAVLESLLGLTAWWLWRHGDWDPAASAVPGDQATGSMPAPTAPSQH
jgi:hypothetical protein